MSSYPSDWKKTRLGDVLEFQVGFPFKSQYFTTVPVGPRLVRNRDLRAEDAVVFYEGPFSPEFIVRPGDVLVGMDGDFAPHVWQRGEALLNQRVGRLNPSARVHTGYLALALVGPLKSLEGATGATTVKHLSHGDVESLVISLPPLAEQEKIAEVINEAGALERASGWMIAKKQSVLQGAMQELLAGRTRLPGFVGAWKTTTLGDQGVFLKGRGVNRKDVRSTGVPCIRYGELYTAFSGYTDVAQSFVSPAVAETALPLQTGDLLFAGSGETRDEIGMCVAYTGPTPAVAGGDIVVLRGRSINPIYLALLMNSPDVARQKSRAGQGDAVVHIYSHALADIEFKLPSRKEQDAIAEVIVAADSEIRLLREGLAKARAVKQGMMQELLSGRTRLPAEGVAA